ncbi:MAG: DUF4825 domain-containing protein [Clostridiales Family XIII bacterium]|nr:DUF4825 domain-containing protein [Clostridiales Family XIII bacterium]
MSAVASITALILFAIKPFVRNRLAKSFQYYIWLVVIILLLVPLRINLPVAAPDANSTHQATGRSIATIRDTVDRYVVTRDELAARTGEEGATPGQANQTIAQNANPGSPFSRWLNAAAVVWPLGVAVFLFINILGYLRFRRGLKKKNMPAREQETALLRQLRPKRAPVLFRNPAAPTPMLIGVFRPAIILPDKEYGDTQIENILLHELAHLKRGDIVVKWLMTFANALHWFNPLVYVTRREMNRACELSCDEAVIKRLDSAAKQRYGDTLISVVAGSGTSRGVLSEAMCEEKKTLKGRLESIMGYKAKSKAIIAFSVVLVLALIAGALALSASVKENSDESGQSGKSAERTDGRFLQSLGYGEDVLHAIGDNSTPYTGDNSKVAAIIKHLPVPWKGLAQDGFSLQTDAEPYGLTIQYAAADAQELTDYPENPFAASIRENNALLLFSAIDNLSVVNNNNPDGMARYSFTREQIQALFGEIPAIKDTGKIEALIARNLRLEEFSFSHASRIYLGSSPDESEYRYGEPPVIEKLDNGFARYQYAGYPDELYYYKEKQLYAKRELAPITVDYDDIIEKFGPPQDEKTVEGKQVISYELRKSESDPLSPPLNDRRAYFVFKDRKLIEEGLMAGDIYGMLIDGDRWND